MYFTYRYLKITVIGTDKGSPREHKIPFSQGRECTIMNRKYNQ